MLDARDIVRLHLGHFTAPPSHHLAGSPIVVTAFLIRHPRGLFLFDTGIGTGNEEAEQHYRPVRRPLREAIAGAGAELEDIRLLANCHLHFDHAGWNRLFPEVPIFAQRTEHEAAFRPDYTMTEAVVGFPGARFELIDGDAEVLPGLRLVRTPGHTDGHQSLIVETRQGRVILAGQAFNAASDYAVAAYQSRLEGAEVPEWVRRFESLDPWRILFAHDLAVWAREGSAARPGSVERRDP
ncbi:MAG: N-acyl homoserine lactonase family protein [Candidatus Limnocylindria bacterium]